MALLEGYYIDENDLLSYIQKDLLDAITTEITEEEENNVQQSIINRCGYADTKLANRYKVPLEAKYQTNALKAAISHLVLFDLLANYDSVSEQELEIRKLNMRNSEAFLNDVRDGRQDLITELNSDNEKTERYYFDSDKRIKRDFY